MQSGVILEIHTRRNKGARSKGAIWSATFDSRWLIRNSVRHRALPTADKSKSTFFPLGVEVRQRFEARQTVQCIDGCL
jgi:hypothetical protein